MQGIKRKVVYVSLYETIAILLTGVVFYLLGFSVFDSWVASVAASGIAVLWNLVWNTLFEYWEARQVKKGRSTLRRIAHAVYLRECLIMCLAFRHRPCPLPTVRASSRSYKSSLFVKTVAIFSKILGTVHGGIGVRQQDRRAECFVAEECNTNG